MSTITDVTTVDYSGDLRVDSLLQVGAAWNYLLPSRTTLYYTFDTSVISAYADSATTAFNASQRAAATAILSHASSITGVGFSLAPSGASADFHFGATDIAGWGTAGETVSAWSYSNSGSTLVTYSADAYVFLDNADFYSENSTPTAGNLGYEILLHEIGHALGLGHPFDDPLPLPDAQDNTSNTVMSYTEAGGYKSTFQPYDLLALSWIYGGDGLGGLYGYNSAYGSSLSEATPDDPPPSDDYAAAIAGAGTMVVGSGTTGAIEAAGDRDWFAVTVQAGRRYQFELEGAASGDGTLADPKLRLLSSSGTTLASNDDDGTSLNARIAYVASASGTLYLEASSATPGGTGTYRIGASVEATNRAPIAAADGFATAEDRAVTGELLANDSDPDGQALTAYLVTPPTHGTLKLKPGGEFSYTPAANYNGGDSFVYGVTDGSLSGTATVTLTISAVNDAPVAVNTTLSVAEDGVLSGRLPSAIDVDGDALAYTGFSTPAHGSVTVSADGRFTYAPRANFNGSDSFVYQVSDAAAGGRATVTVIVSAVNDAPVAADAAITTLEDTALAGSLPSAVDVDGDAVAYALATAPAHGSVAIAPSGQYTYTPQADYFGADAFSYRVGDAKGAANTYTVGVDVVAVVDATRGTEGADTLVDRTGDARLLGHGDDDVLHGGSGDDALDGGGGTDVATYAGAAAGYSVARTGSGWRVTDLVGGEGVDTLTSIERLQFADKAFELVGTTRDGAGPAFGVSEHFLFDPVFYLLDNPELVPTQSVASAWAHYVASGAAQGRAPTSWYDAAYYEAKWDDLTPLGLDDATLFIHFNLYGVWEGRSPGPGFDAFDGERYLAQNPDVAAYVDANLPSFLDSRSNGAIAHYILYGADESRLAYDLSDQPVRADYVIDLGA